MGLILLQQYLRHFPFAFGKAYVWNRVVGRLVQKQKRNLKARTTFGAVIDIDCRDAIQRWVYFFGIFEPCITAYMRRILRPGDVFIDIGANVGYYALLGAKLVGRFGKVIAIEPSPSIFAVLESNLRRNDARNVAAMNLAITDTAKDVVVFLHDVTNRGGTTIMPGVAGRRPTTAEAIVPGVPLGHAINIECLRRAKLIKIDVEGAEWQVLQGLREVFPTLSQKTQIIIEVDSRSLKDQGIKVSELFDLIRFAGFRPFIIPNEYNEQFYIKPPRGLEDVVALEPASEAHLEQRELTDLVLLR